MKNNLQVVVGLGATGFSCVNYLMSAGFRNIAVTDTRAEPPFLKELNTQFPDIAASLNRLDEQLLDQASRIIISPGVSLKEVPIAKQVKRGIPVIGDIELFSQAITAHNERNQIKKKIIAITGTNAKSTVTTLVGLMAQNAKIKVAVGGNLGIPALDLLKQQDADLYVMELSSFQLETTYSLKSAIATVLNITPDHMDRYANLNEYIAAKHRVYHQCEIAVCNKDDEMTDCKTLKKPNKYYFTLSEPQENEFGLLVNQKKKYLAFSNYPLMAIDELPILGMHYQANALAALAIGHAYGLPLETMLQTLRDFKGLAHRCELIAECEGINWYNDSKGTNVGATLAAIKGLGAVISGKLIIIAGGLGKNADFSPLLPALKEYAKHVVLIGKDASIIAETLKDHTSYDFASSMEEAVKIARQHASRGDSVLLSPACASMDMFKNFEHRGEVFSKCVRGLLYV